MWFMDNSKNAKPGEGRRRPETKRQHFERKTTTEDFVADQEVSNIVAWALEDVKVTKDDDQSFEAIELVSSEDGDKVAPTVINVEADGSTTTVEPPTVIDVCEKKNGSKSFEEDSGGSGRSDAPIETEAIEVEDLSITVERSSPTVIDVCEEVQERDEEVMGGKSVRVDPPDAPIDNNEMESATKSFSSSSDAEEGEDKLSTTNEQIAHDNGKDERETFVASCAAKIKSTETPDVINVETEDDCVTREIETPPPDNLQVVIHVEEDSEEADALVGEEKLAAPAEETEEQASSSPVSVTNGSSLISIHSEHASSTVSTNARIDSLKMRLRRMEKQHEEYVVANQEINETRFQVVENKLEVQRKELEVTKENLKEAQIQLEEQSKYHAGISAEQQVLLERIGLIERRLMKEDPPGSPVTPTTASGNELSSNINEKSTTNTPAEFEAMIQKLVKIELQQLFAESHEQFAILQQKAEKQGKKLDLNHLREEQEEQQQLCDANVKPLARQEDEQDESLNTLEAANLMIQGDEKVMVQRKGELVQAAPERDPSGLDASSSNSSTNSSSADKILSRRAIISGMHSESTERMSNRQNAAREERFEDEEDCSSTYREKRDEAMREKVVNDCREIMERENEHLMKTWGTHFQDLATLVQNELEKQRESIIETRTTTFEHVDAESKARATVWNAQYNQLAREIMDIKEDSERALQILVETMVNLKTKVDEYATALTAKPTLSSESGANVFDTEPLLQQLVDQKTTQLESEISKCRDEVQGLKSELKLVHCATADIVQDHEAMQSILDTTIDVFNKKMETNVDVWTIQLGDLQRDLEEYVQRNFGRKRDQEKLKEKMETVVKKLDTTYVDLIQVLNEQAKELRSAQEAQLQVVQLKAENRKVEAKLEKVTNDLLKVVDGQAAEIKAAKEKHTKQAQKLRADGKLSMGKSQSELVTKENSSLVPCLKSKDPPTKADNKDIIDCAMLTPKMSRSRSCTPPPGKKKVTFDDGSIPAVEQKQNPTVRRSPLPELRLIENRHEVEFFDLTDFDPKRDPEVKTE